MVSTRNMKTPRRYLMIGAHPDDPDIRFGGSAIKLIKAGHVVKFVSLTNGCCGHQTLSGKELADRRYAETQKAKAVIGLSEYEVWRDSPDCELEPTVANRKRLIRLIRDFRPDVVLSHRLCDYHADHRAAAQLVQDAAYLTQVPQFCPESPIPEESPVFGCVWDSFTIPLPFRADAAIPIDDVIDESEVTLAVTEIEDLDGVAFAELVGETEICHIGASCGAVNGKEAESCGRDVI